MTPVRTSVKPPAAIPEMQKQETQAATVAPKKEEKEESDEDMQNEENCLSQSSCSNESEILVVKQVIPP